MNINYNLRSLFPNINYNTIQVLTIAFGMFFLFSCQNAGTGTSGNNAAKAPPLSASEFGYFAKEYKGSNLKADFKLDMIKEQSFEEKYKGSPAKYQAKAYNITRTGDNAPCGILVELGINRIQTALQGKGERKSETQYICLPSAKASANLHQQYNTAIRSLGYKDFEVFTSFLSRVLAEKI